MECFEKVAFIRKQRPHAPYPCYFILLYMKAQIKEKLLGNKIS